MSNQLGLYWEPAPTEQPSAEELRAEILDTWLRVQLYCTPEKFRATQRAWIERNNLPRELLDYDPAARTHGVDYDWCPRNEPDALDRIALENAYFVEDRIGKDRLRAAGWIVDPVPPADSLPF